jgi:hypothetical protein
MAAFPFLGCFEDGWVVKDFLKMHLKYKIQRSKKKKVVYANLVSYFQLIRGIRPQAVRDSNGAVRFHITTMDIRFNSKRNIF